MTYRPAESTAFGPPMADRWPVLAYLAFALGITGVIVYGQNAASGTRLFQYVVEGDRHRFISSSVCAILLTVSAIAAVLREQMRGVVVHPDGIELRELLALGWPKIRRFAWSQIDRVSVPSATGPQASIRLDLWDGSRTWLPRVRKSVELATLLERVALARAIPIEGGTGLLDDMDEGATEDGAPDGAAEA
jgi:hypothetical protein